MTKYDEFECGCIIMKKDEWNSEIITCMMHSQRNEEEGGLNRFIYLTKPTMEMIHP